MTVAYPGDCNRPYRLSWNPSAQDRTPPSMAVPCNYLARLDDFKQSLSTFEGDIGSTLSCDVTPRWSFFKNQLSAV